MRTVFCLFAFPFLPHCTHSSLVAEHQDWVLSRNGTKLRAQFWGEKGEKHEHNHDVLVVGERKRDVHALPNLPAGFRLWPWTAVIRKATEQNSNKNIPNAHRLSGLARNRNRIAHHLSTRLLSSRPFRQKQRQQTILCTDRSKLLRLLLEQRGEPRTALNSVVHHPTTRLYRNLVSPSLCPTHRKTVPLDVTTRIDHYWIWCIRPCIQHTKQKWASKRTHGKGPRPVTIGRGIRGIRGGTTRSNTHTHTHNQSIRDPLQRFGTPELMLCFASAPSSGRQPSLFQGGRRVFVAWCGGTILVLVAVCDSAVLSC